MNNQTKIKVIRELSPEDLAKKLNQELKLEGVFASPIIQDRVSNQWIAFIYYKSLNKTDETLPIKKVDDTKPKFKPTEKQLQRWKNQEVTPKTYGLLLAKGFKKEDIKRMKQLDAYYALNNLEEENI